MTTTHRIFNHPVATGAVAAVLALTFASGASAQGEGKATVRDIHRLGGSTAFYQPPLKAVDTLKRMGNDPKVVADVRTVFGQAGMTELSNTVVAAMASANTSVRGGWCSDATPADGTIVECDVQPGQVIQWMAYRPKGNSQLDLLRDIRWAGAKPFAAYLFRVTRDNRIYTFVVPKICGNVSLMNVMDAPRPAVVVPPPAPAPPPPPPPAPAPEPPPPPAPAPPPPMPQAPPPPEVNASMFFADALFGKDRRTRPIEDTGLEYSQCSPLVGLKVGVFKQFDNNWEIAGAVGIAISLVSADDKVQEHEVFADVELNKHFGNRVFAGTGLSMWDLNHSDTWTPAWMLHTGIPLNSAGAKVPTYFLLEARMFLDHADDIRSNYQFWGGVRMRF